MTVINGELDETETAKLRTTTTSNATGVDLIGRLLEEQQSLTAVNSFHNSIRLPTNRLKNSITNRYCLHLLPVKGSSTRSRSISMRALVAKPA